MAEETGASPFYIPASSSLLERRPRTLKNGDTFAMFDHYGDIAGGNGNPEGLYHRDTRFLSVSRLEVEQRKPLLLSSTVQNNNALLIVDLTNQDIYAGEDLHLPRDTVHLRRSKYVWGSACFETIAIQNFDIDAREISISLFFEADFSDVFEVRGHVRDKRGTQQRSVPANDRVLLHYTGLDECVRSTELVFDPTPHALSAHRAEWRLCLKPGTQQTLSITVACGKPAFGDYRFVSNLRRANRERERARRRYASVHTSNHIFNEVLRRSMADLVMLTTETPSGPYPYAGVPWFSTAFGRDGIITAIEMLPFDPELSRGVLKFLAAMQSSEINAMRDAEPGKILHEMRQGEMAALGEVPFGKYYGSVDSTPLFVLLAGLYWERTGDSATILGIWPNICAALEWITNYGDPDGDGFVEYLRKSENGLANQGWKDSEDSIFHSDGALATGSIALCEVQAYVYAAKMHAATMADALQHHSQAERLRAEAEILRTRFEENFWIEEQSCYALALDGDKRPCKVRSSNVGHVLFCGIADPERAAHVARLLTARDMFSGWGIRTISAAEARYNPMSYHNGSVWPHDNALAAIGLARYGHMNEVRKVLNAIFEASTHMDLRRLPELFCGIRRKPDRSPTFYPVACLPQAWASAAPFAMLAATLGLTLDAASEKIRFINPHLPDFLDNVELTNLRLGSSVVDILLRRRGNGVAVNVLSKQGPASVEVLL